MDEDEILVFIYIVVDDEGNFDVGFVDLIIIFCFVVGMLIDIFDGFVVVEEFEVGMMVLICDNGG